MNKKNRPKNSPRIKERYLNAAERRALRKWEKLKEEYSDDKQKLK